MLDNAELCILAVMYRFRPVPYEIMRMGVGRSAGTGGRMHCAGEVDNGHRSLLSPHHHRSSADQTTTTSTPESRRHRGLRSPPSPTL